MAKSQYPPIYFVNGEELYEMISPTDEKDMIKRLKRIGVTIHGEGDKRYVFTEELLDKIKKLKKE